MQSRRKGDPKLVSVKCGRSFFLAGERINVDQIVDVDERLARELVSVKKAVRVQATNAAAPAKYRPGIDPFDRL